MAENGIDIKRTTNPNDLKGWNFAGRVPEISSFADQPEWTQLVCEHFGTEFVGFHTPLQSHAKGMAMFSVNRSFLAGYHGKTAPLAASGGGLLSNSAETSDALMGAIEGYSKAEKLEYVLLRLLEPNPSAQARGWALIDRYFRFLIELNHGTEHIWDNVFRDKTRNQIRKAESYGFDIIHGGAELAGELSSVVLRCMRDLGSPAPDIGFFRNLADSFPETVRFIVIRDSGKPVAASVITFFQDCAAVPWAITMSEYRPKCVNSLLYWESIKLAVERNGKVFDMGRSAEGQGTFDFKRRLGGMPVQLYYYIFSPIGVKPHIPDGTGKLSLPRRIWSMMPLPLAKRITRRVYREIV
ncbi:MAG: GNAT family N-acetyltransferase [Rhodospirillales bacterium]